MSREMSRRPVGVSSEWCQRWLLRRHSWRHRRDGGFDKSRFRVIALDEAPARAFTTAHHYSGPSWPAARLRFGLIDLDPAARHLAIPAAPVIGDGQLVGVAVLAVPMHPRVLTKPFPDLRDPYVEAAEIARFTILSHIAANGESFLLGKVLRMSAQYGLRAAVAHSDPVPRFALTPQGYHLTTPGHCGVIYSATGATYLGRATPRTIVLLPDATTLTARAIAKIVGHERGAGGVIARLQGFGARPLRAGEDRRAWLDQALRHIGARRRRHPGNHKFAWSLPNQRERLVIAMPALPYPKRHTGGVDPLPDGTIAPGGGAA